MAKGDFYFPVFYQRLLTSTSGWKDDEFGCYFRLLIHQFDKGSIPDDINKLARISPSVRKHWNHLIKEKFVSDGNGGLINTVMDEIRKDIEQMREKNKENGRKGGRSKKPTAKPVGNPPLASGLTQTITQMEPIPITNIQYPKEERETPPVLFPIEQCLTIAMKDQRWVKASKATEPDLRDFNAVLEKRGDYEKNPKDYKSHFANWKKEGSVANEEIVHKTTMVI